ncbi:hypothetical protein ACFVS2_25910 [Brevibacillus sp. NPDC058079]|uniref:hypothetical protein n=1 Tax=Brevibacillus sp. NPDC058079 TaxID=3346330 RepID=UPI0036F0FC86
MCVVAYGDDKLEQGKMYKVLAHPIDKSKWYIVSENNEWSLHDKWRFEHTINQYAVCEEHYGLFQLPILEIGKVDYTVILPTGFVSKVSMESCRVESYTYAQKINCGDLRFH